MKKLLAILLSVVILAATFSLALGVTAGAANATVTYTFTGTNASQKGFAQGNITVSVGAGEGGTYTLFWADDSAVLKGYKAIGSVSVSSNGSATFTMPEFTAIPADATKVAAFKGTASGALSSAGVYNIPANKRIGHRSSEKLYSFAAFSDIHIASQAYKVGYEKYPYDEQHLADAWKTAASRDVDFVVTTGDHINNQRNDDNGGNNNLYADEWNTYLKILADSDYTGPVYEAIGNHELWNYDTENLYRRDWKTGSDYFVQISGLSGEVADYNSGHAYYEVTEPVTGDHFLFMALEGGFYTDRIDEFSDAQLKWLEGKLKAYQNDGKNVFIMEHANFYKWGSGDQVDNPIYDIPLKDNNSSTAALKKLLQTYKNAVVITGHTHFKFSLQLNFSTNNNSSATMIHNSSVGGVRDIKNRITRVNDTSRENTEGYMVEVYDNATIFYGMDLYKNEIIPVATYIVPQTTSAQQKPTVPTETQTQKPTETKPTETKPTETAKATEATKPTETQTEKPSETQTESVTETQAPTPSFIWGDVDDNGILEILDATAVQQHLARMITIDDELLLRGMVTGDTTISILDVTCIQQKLAKILDIFPVEEKEIAAVAADSIKGENYEIVEVAAAPQLEPAGADLSTLRTQAQSALSKYYLMASYPQYAALKKAYKENADLNTLNAAYESFNTAIKNFYPGDTIDVYFENDQNWSTVNAYCYTVGGATQNASWPGQACTKTTATRNGKTIYKYSVPIGKYTYIIFNNGSAQTVDLALGAAKNQGYYLDGSSNGKYLGKQFVYQ